MRGLIKREIWGELQERERERKRERGGRESRE